MTRQEKYIANFSRMIRKETVSVREEHPDITKFLEFHQILRETFPHIFAVCDFEEFEGSILMRWPGSEPGKNLPVLFLCHHDVVEAPGEWKHGPFSADIADGKIWGRGTLDTKGGLFGFLQAADELAEEGYQPKRDIYFESACTEETTGKGAMRIVEVLKSRGVKLEMTFDEGGMAVYEPIGGVKATCAMVGLGEKGICEIKFTARSAGGHASTPGKNTPLVRLGKFMAEVDDRDPFEKKINPVIRSMFLAFAPYMGKLSGVMGHPDFFDVVLRNAMPAISPTAGALVKTTLAFTVAHGSEGSNVLPQEAYVIGNMRYSHHQGLQGSVDALRPIAKKYDIEIEVMNGGTTSRLTDPNGTAFRLVEEAVRATMPNVAASVPYIMTQASDSRFFDAICDQCIRFLPFTISKEQMASIHGLNECVDVDTLVPAVDYYRYLMKKF